MRPMKLVLFGCSRLGFFGVAAFSPGARTSGRLPCTKARGLSWRRQSAHRKLRVSSWRTTSSPGSAKKGQLRLPAESGARGPDRQNRDARDGRCPQPAWILKDWTEACQSELQPRESDRPLESATPTTGSPPSSAWARIWASCRITERGGNPRAALFRTVAWGWLTPAPGPKRSARNDVPYVVTHRRTGPARRSGSGPTHPDFVRSGG